MKGIQVKCGLLAKGTLAMALFPFILLNPKYPVKETTINHERIHLKQQVEMLIIPFYIWYLIELLFKGYHNISFERECHENDKNMSYLSTRKWYSWVKYL